MFLYLFTKIFRKISKTFAYVINNYCKDIEIFDERGYDEEINYFDGFYLMRKK